MQFIELYFDYPEKKPEPFTPNKMGDSPKVRKCRYCGLEGDRKTLRYERGLRGEANYDCRDSQSCGERIRQKKGVVADDDCPF